MDIEPFSRPAADQPSRRRSREQEQRFASFGCEPKGDRDKIAEAAAGFVHQAIALLLAAAADTHLQLGVRSTADALHLHVTPAAGNAALGSGDDLRAAARTVAADAGGRLERDAADPDGAFTLVLPLPERAAPGAGSADAAGPSSNEPLRVLVIDDNKDAQRLVRLLLRQHCEMDLASSGASALERAREKQYAAVLLDINLGDGQSGIDVLHALRALPGYDACRIVALTAYAMPGDEERFLEEGFDHYVGKPFTREELLEALAPVFG